MTTPDVINGLFEGLGSVIVWVNVRQLLFDKVVRGIRWEFSAFFTGWSAWNIYYYPHLGQWASFVGGLCLLFGNLTWLCLAVYYMKIHNKW